jgi:Domain of unknown function (DUF4304)
MKKNDIVRIIDPLLKNEGYVRKGSSWYKDVATMSPFLNLQKSRWGEQYFISLNVVLKHLLQKEKFSHHVAIRFEPLVGDDVVKIFDLENELKDGDREAEIINVVKTIMPTLKQFESAEGIKEVVKKYNGSVMTTKGAKDFLELTGQKPL